MMSGAGAPREAVSRVSFSYVCIIKREYKVSADNSTMQEKNIYRIVCLFYYAREKYLQNSMLVAVVMD